MTFNKKALALAISASALLPASASAVDIFGFVNVAIENTSLSGAGAGNEIFATGADGSTHGQDVAETRFGFKDSRDLGNGLTGSFKIEMGLGTSAAGAGGVNEDSTPTTRIAQVALSGDFGTVTVGNQWGILYEYLGWNIYRTHGHGGGTWYHTTQHLNDDAYGLRVQNAFTYTYGGGGYGTDPFTFSVQVVAEPDTATDDEFMDAVVFGAAFTTGDLTINAVSYSESDGSGAAEPSLIGLGARYNLSGDTYVGGTYMQVDNDAGQDLSSFNVLLTHHLGDGLSGMIGYGFSDADAPLLELDSNLLLQLEKDLGAGLITYVEIETAELSNGDETRIVSGNLKYNF
jgi:predicted porin